MLVLQRVLANPFFTIPTRNIPVVLNGCDESPVHCYIITQERKKRYINHTNV